MDHLNQQQKDPTKKINIGIILSFEKKLLESSIGAKDDLKKIVYKSGWVGMYDKYSKLRIEMQGERLLSVIQKRMWNNLAKNTSVIQVCQDHNENVSLSVRDIINISFKPFLRDIASVVSTLLVKSRDVEIEVSDPIEQSSLSESIVIKRRYLTQLTSKPTLIKKDFYVVIVTSCNHTHYVSCTHFSNCEAACEYASTFR
ncbi:hypothetical protein BD770DRAFT_464073 [Pilaira anomala]|nr:hypothetical protein BD770DRAFT_464073 [Pilaira anomala]